MARAGIEEERSVSRPERLVRKLALQELMPHRERLRFLARGLMLYQRLGLPKLIESMNVLPQSLREMEALLPQLSGVFPDYSRPAAAIGRRRGKVALLYGCVQDAFLGNVNAATIRVLQRNGYEVHFPEMQTCCGAAALHIGEGDLASELARQNLDAVDPDAYEAIISNAGGCGTTLKEYGHLLADDPQCSQKSARFCGKTTGH